MSEKWQLFQGNGQRREGVTEILKNLEPPPWRKFGNPEDLAKKAEEIRKNG
jgi:hypothetical protein